MQNCHVHTLQILVYFRPSSSGVFVHRLLFMDWRMVLNIANREQDILAYKAYFLTLRIPLGIPRNCLVTSSLYSFL